MNNITINKIANGFTVTVPQSSGPSLLVAAPVVYAFADWAALTTWLTDRGFTTLDPPTQAE